MVFLIFSHREINKLIYAVYSYKDYVFDSEDENAPQPSYESNGNFTLKLTLPANCNNPRIFFWACNSEDDITFDSIDKASTTNVETINLDLPNAKVSVNPAYINNIESYGCRDSFTGYFSLNEPDIKKQFTLKRPFALFHVLTDESINGAVKTLYPEGIKIKHGFRANNGGYTLQTPLTWYFSNEDLKSQYTDYVNTPFYFQNTLSGTEPERTTFKNKEMDYLGCYYVLAPQETGFYKILVGSGAYTTWADFSYYSLNICDNDGTTISSPVINLPSNGIKANNIYVIYNTKLNDDGTGEGFFTKSYSMEVITDPEWGDTNEISY